MKKRLIALLLAAVYLLIPLAHAAGTLLSLHVPDTLPDVGESFTVTVELSGNPGLSSVQFVLAYDDAVLECTEASTGELLNGMLAATNLHRTSAPAGAAIAAAAATNVKEDGVLARFTFTVKAAGEADLQLKNIILSNEDGQELTYTLRTTGSAQKPGTDTPGTAETPDAPQDPAVRQPEQAEVSGSTVFTDVPDLYWAASQIKAAAELGLAAGFSDGSFQPGSNVTRAQFVMMLWRMAGKPAAGKTAAFTDASRSDWYAEALDWAAENGYVTGLSDGRFNPNGSITRQQVMAILFRYAGSQSGMESMLTGIYDSAFTDSGSIAVWAKPAVYWAVYKGIVTGATKTTIEPNATATRAQIAVIFLRYMEKLTASGEETLS